MPILPSTHISLLSELKEGGRQEEAWAVFYGRYSEVIRGWCLRRGLPLEAAEDLTQDILLKLFQQLPRYRHEPSRGQFRGWLKAVVNNALTDFWRRQRRRPERGAVGGSAFLERLNGMAGPEAAQELSAVIDDHSRTTAAEMLERVRARLKETTWAAFHQSMVEQRPAAEVAAGLNLSVASVYKAAYRVKQMLLEEYRHVYPSSHAPALVSESGDAGKTLA
jgi:RNA polymerase sigma-70 factor (ECF subfamily)